MNEGPHDGHKSSHKRKYHGHEINTLKQMRWLTEVTQSSDLVNILNLTHYNAMLSCFKSRSNVKDRRSQCMCVKILKLHQEEPDIVSIVSNVLL